MSGCDTSAGVLTAPRVLLAAPILLCSVKAEQNLSAFR